jgi:hypothetical protein
MGDSPLKHRANPSFSMVGTSFGDRKLTTDHIKTNFKGCMDEISDLTVV